MMRTMRRGLIVVALLVALVIPASAGAVQGYKAECQTAFCGGVSEDGTRAVFPFYEELTRGAPRAQVYERFAGETRALIPYPDDPPKPTYAGLVGLSDDARHVFVSTNLALAPEDRDGGGTDIYDIHGGDASLLSTGPLDTGAEPGFGPLSVPAFFMGASADGTRVFMDSIFEGLVPEDTDRCIDVYERFDGQTRFISTGPAATPSFPEGTCDMASYDGLSSDGSHVFFKTGDHLIPEDEGGTDIYQRVGDALAVLTTYPEVERNCTDLPWFGDASADGTVVLFSTNIPIVAEDQDSTYDVYKRLPDGSFSLVSRGTEGGIGPCGFSGDTPVALSADGRTAIFVTLARLSPEDRDSSADLYSTDDSGTMSLITTGPADASLDETPFVLPAWPADVSDDASHVAFETRQPLVEADDDKAVDVYLRAGGRTELVSTGPLGGNANVNAELLSISGDGETIAFATKERLTDEDTDRAMDFYLRRPGQLIRPGSASSSVTRPKRPRARRTVLISAESIAPRMRVSRLNRLLPSGVVEIHLACPKAEKSGPCRGRVKLGPKRHGAPIGSARFQVTPGHYKLIQVRLRRSFSGSSLFARVRARDRLGNSATTIRRITLLDR